MEMLKPLTDFFQAIENDCRISITHIGIYLGDNRFAHASSSRGVVISNLNEPYYSRYFYKGGRILDGVKKDLIQE